MYEIIPAMEENTQKKIPLLPIVGTVVAIVLMLSAFTTGVFVGSNKDITKNMPAFAANLLPATQPEGLELEPLWRTWNVINEKFVSSKVASSTASSTDSTIKGPTDEEKVWGMIQGLAASLDDPYTVFMPPSEAEIFQDDISGSFEGVGMEIAIRNRILTVVAPLKDTPAYRAGLKSGDLITKIDETDTKNMSVNDAVKLIRGPRGSTVRLTVIREGELDLLKIDVIRDTINIPTIETYKRSDGIFVIELMSFTAVSPDLFRKAIKEFTEAKTDKLIVDLRGNPGGYLQAAVDMASWFLPSGGIVVTEDYGDNQEKTVHRSNGYNIFNEHLKLVILVNKGSASASEILAGALRDHDKATLVGTNTFGKGSVQELVDITDDTSLKITVARWILPDGGHIGGGGIEPEVLVELTDEQKEKLLEDEDYDPIMERGVEYLLNN